MPRKRRIWESGRCYHIMLRGIDGRSVFIDDRDKSRFCLFLQEASEIHKFRVHAFCLMTNHIHLLLEPIEDGLARGIHRFATRYAQHFNSRHKKRGYVFQGRFKSILVEDGIYMKRLLRYIHLNPIEAGLVERLQDFPWSSHNGYFSRTDFVWLETERILSYFGPTRSTALANLAEFTTDQINLIEELKEIELASRTGVYGSEEFKRAFVTITNTNKKFECSAKDNEHAIKILMNLVCARLKVTTEQLISEEKERNIVNARAVLAKIAQIQHGLNLSDISRALNKHPGTISRLAKHAAKDPELYRIVHELIESESIS
jgi:putative transposase